MYEHSHNSFPPEFFTLSELPPPPPSDGPFNYFMPPPPLAIPPFELDSTTIDADGGGYDSPSSQISVVMQRSGSVDCIATSTQINNNGLLFQLVSSPTELFDSNGSSSSVTKVFSAGDLQGANTMQHHHRSKSPLSNENNIIIESMNKTCRYSPKEKQERIERYRRKKNQRNFKKKIMYVCRKTLADNRPRVKGRFARDNEIERTNNQGGGDEGFEFDKDSVNKWMFYFSDAFTSNPIS